MTARIPEELAGHRWGAPREFLGVEPGPAGWEEAAVAVLPVPHEATTSWGTGTREGPRAILEASRHLELYDEELDAEPHAAGIFTLPPVELTLEGPGEAVEELRALYDDLLDVAGDRLVIALGGEHSLSSAPALAWVDRLGEEVSVLQLDAHADLRDTYRGTPWSHACVMRRILERTSNVVPVGLRSLTSEERDVLRRREVPAVFAEEMREEGWVRRAVEPLAEHVYVTVDVDFFDPSVVPATGTPEPGGAGWWQALDLVREVFRTRRVVGADVVELAPDPLHRGANVTAAKLVYKMIGYATR